MKLHETDFKIRDVTKKERAASTKNIQTAPKCFYIKLFKCLLIHEILQQQSGKYTLTSL